MFKFLSCVTKKEGYKDIVKNNWGHMAHGNAMRKLWTILRRLQNPFRPLYKRFTDIQIQIQRERQDLTEAQKYLLNNMVDSNAIEQVKRYTKRVMDLSHVEEEILRKKSKVYWLKLGYGNNTFFHSSMKDKNKHKSLSRNTFFFGGAMTLMTMDGEELPHLVNADVVEKYFA